MYAKVCAAVLAAFVTATPIAVAQAETAKPSPGKAAASERQKKCGAEWKAAKAAGTVEKGMKWPQFWSACNKRLKASAG